MDKQGEKFLEALRKHLDSISADELYRRLKRNSHPDVKGQSLDDFLKTGEMLDHGSDN